MKNITNKLALAGVIATAGASSFAVGSGVDFTALTGGIDFSTVVTAILAVASLKVLPLVSMWGAKKILGMVGR